MIRLYVRSVGIFLILGIFFFGNHLREKEAHDFINKVESGLKKPAKLISIPKIENARKMVMNYVPRIKK